MKLRHSILAAISLGFAGVLALHAVTGTPTPSAVAPPTTTSPTRTTSPTTVPTGLRSAVGPSESYGYGAISVKVTVRGSRITNVSVASLQTAESYSQSIAGQADPILTSEALSAQSANIQSVSGASYTSQGFIQSLQAALGDLGL